MSVTLFSSVERPKPTRRWALKVLGAALVVGPATGALIAYVPRPEVLRWEGVSLGGPAQMELWHPNPSHAQRVLYKLRAEIERLEAIFSLYRHDSEIAQLNQYGVLHAPSEDFRAVLTHALDLARVSGGAFDPTVQPLWRLYDAHFRRDPDAARGPSAAIVGKTLTTVGHGGVEMSAGLISFARPGMGLTLNGVAQGYITDRIAAILLHEGFEHAIVDIGETRAIGEAPQGHPWSIGVKDPQNPLVANRAIEIVNQAVSVSGGYGTPFGSSDSHHIFDPRTGLSARQMLDVAVTAPRAMEADGLSTAIYVGGEDAGKKLLAHYRDASATITRLDGAIVAL